MNVYIFPYFFSPPDAFLVFSWPVCYSAPVLVFLFYILLYMLVDFPCLHPLTNPFASTHVWLICSVFLPSLALSLLSRCFIPGMFLSPLWTISWVFVSFLSRAPSPTQVSYAPLHFEILHQTHHFISYKSFMLLNSLPPLLQCAYSRSLSPALWN